MVGDIGLIFVTCFKMYSKWKRAWKLLLLIGAKGGAGAGLFRAVSKSCAASVEALVFEALGMLIWDRNQEYVSTFLKLDVLGI